GEGLVSIDSVYAPGNSAAAVSFEGDLALGFASVLEIELGGTGAGEFDRLLIDGDLDIGDLSQLDVSLIDGFDLGFGQEFLFADVEGSLNGVFNGLSEGATVGNYGGQDLFITYNGFGGNAGVGLFTAVPEPSSVLTLVFIGMGAMLRRKRAATVVGSQVT
ncbi:MAG: PEP-CTERM sorting domain-containing protein, partial [Pirellulaceae bacterium]